MRTYGFLLIPSHHRGYARFASALARAELLVLNDTVLGGRLTDVGGTTLGGVPYLTFRAPELTGDDLRYLANLSALYAVFEIADGRLTPLDVPRLDKFGGDLITAQRYPGKTDEDFTKLLLNVTAMACDTPERLLDGGLRVLDPLCGRGTTLNQAVMYGLDAAGVERDAKSFEAYGNFLRHWLKDSRIKHQAATTTVRRDRRALGRRLHVTLGESKESYKKGEAIELTMIHADTAACGDFFRPASFDLIVTDAPHGGASRGETSRGPLGLLSTALPVWARLLRPGGAIGIAWNAQAAPREELAALLAGQGLEVREDEPYRGFRHRVDHAVLRDVVVARRPAD
ncbi:TRM11 family SAM-dependent methyltransferase [Streptomyces specialis]|uniref:TRM11 family SAM-dependent methyltransferase n=1 Tax=Streptomyces specialis TaxID=498367 RepID=UPI00073F47A5|nr:DNA modification methylase [Streptomyces specialis]